MPRPRGGPVPGTSVKGPGAYAPAVEDAQESGRRDGEGARLPKIAGFHFEVTKTGTFHRPGKPEEALSRVLGVKTRRFRQVLTETAGFSPERL